MRVAGSKGNVSAGLRIEQVIAKWIANGPHDERWKDRAACRPGTGVDPAIFFHADDIGPGRVSSAEALLVCLDCEVRVECLEYALAADLKDGIFGGMNQSQRRRLAKERRDAEFLRRVTGEA
ncbi:WhiB family transcriptional regulator [Mycobacterium sp. G7A2]|uniref:WhiB family transcriptional regulator n=1 Tax=Mycobacterium sp. G7A2 TaxID=3317307 RepID=UPI0035A96B1E